HRADRTYGRPVALKVVRPGLSADVGPRFERERELLGSLNHPHVAKLLDAGTLPDGRPWLAMEFVEGEPITAYANARGLGVEARLRLVLQVCDAVAYAHQQLVVHRDLKPSNVLVTDGASGESAPRAVLLDFGIATLVREDGAAATKTGRALLTPAYAAPEQVRDEPASTTADVYALGGLLYELLSGARTVETENRPPHEVAQAVLDDVPPPPSVAATAAAARHRATTPDKLARRLRGDLDRIVMMALRKEPERRYPSVEAFARDLRRHLNGRAVEARPDTLGYRLSLFVRRNRVSVAAGAIALMAIVTGFGAAVWQAREARAESLRATAEAQRAGEVAAFMTDLLADFDPSRSDGGNIQADSVLARAADRVREGLDAHPDVRAALLGSLGQIHQSYADFDRADSLFSEALGLRRAHFGTDHPSVATSLRDLAWLAYVRGHYDRSEALYTDALALHRATLGEVDIEVAADLEGLGLVRRVRGDLDTAYVYLREALDIRESLLPPTDERVVANLNSLAYVLYNLKRYDEAEPVYRRVIAMRRQRLGDHVQTAQALNDYAALLLADDRGDEALALHREALAIRRRLLGDEHPHVAQSLSQVGWVLQTQGQYAEAEVLYREALDVRQAHFGDTHVSVANSLLMLGEASALQGETARGLGLVARGVRTMEAALGAQARSTHLARLRYAERLADAGRTDAARREASGAAAALLAESEPGSSVAERIATLEARLGGSLR
ncbi:MAG: serine/threonine-protein kinase, partial [Bacteroidota bacterium]